MSLRNLSNRTLGAGSNHGAEHKALWLHSLNRFKAMTEGSIGGASATRGMLDSHPLRPGSSLALTQRGVNCGATSPK